MRPNAPAHLPGWVGILQAAETWGVPPWVVTGEAPPARMIWYLRYRAYADEVARGQRDAQKHENRNG